MQEYTDEEVNQRFALLDRYERRCIIYFLQETETGQASISDVATHLQRQDPTPDERDELAIALHHNHLPKLAAIDAFDLDSGSETVRYDGDELLEALLEVPLESELETYMTSV